MSAPTPLPNRENLQPLISEEHFSTMIAAMKNNKIPLIGTMMFQPTGVNHSFAIDDETARQMIADQYGADSSIAKEFPGWDHATLSVRAGMITFIEAKIASSRTAP